MPKSIDLMEMAGGKVEFKTFSLKLDSVDWDAYKGEAVQLKGCAPTWAHLLVAGRLFGKASKVEFLMDDRAGAIPIAIFGK